MPYRLKVGDEVYIECDTPEEAWRMVGMAAVQVVTAQVPDARGVVWSPAIPPHTRASESPGRRHAISDRRAAILEQLRAHGGTAVGTDIRDAMGRPSRVTFHNDMRWLLDQGLIVRSEVGVYRLKIHGPQLVVGGEGS